MGNDVDSPPEKRKVKPSRLALASGAEQAVSLIPSLIHVRLSGSITVYYWILSWVYTPAWPVMDCRP